tara:strand:+ start:6131 stop:7051 length:921 start_codon:yes stop_codon:yes gene_type:complete
MENIQNAQRPNTLYAEDNLKIMQQFTTESIALIYMDPPFFTNTIRKNSDKDNHKLSYPDDWNNNLPHYLSWLEERIVEMYRLLNKHGSLFIHCDWHASHHIKILLDKIFGNTKFQNEIIWHYTGGGRSRKRFSRKHDSIFWYTKTDEYTFNIDSIRTNYSPQSGYAKGGIVAKSGKFYSPHPLGTPFDNVWNIPIINPLSKERTGYPTQKPIELLQRIIDACSNPNDLVADFTCGSGSFILAASGFRQKRTSTNKLSTYYLPESSRYWIGCDNSKQAIDLTYKRILTFYEKYAPDETHAHSQIIIK